MFALGKGELLSPQVQRIGITFGREGVLSGRCLSCLLHPRPEGAAAPSQTSSAVQYLSCNITSPKRVKNLSNVV